MPPAEPPPTPRDLKALRAVGVLELTWSDRVDRLPFRFLRAECGCAQCVHEWTGQRLVDPALLPEDVAVEELQLVGNYAVRIRWSDGHTTGLYTWERLRELGRRDEPR